MPISEDVLEIFIVLEAEYGWGHRHHPESEGYPEI
jgi:hypothetical protein